MRIGNGAEDAKVGLVVFNTRQATVFGLDTFDNNNDLDRALRNLGRDRAVDMSQAGNSYGFSIPSGGTKTRQGLQHLRDYLIPESKALAAASTNGRTCIDDSFTLCFVNSGTPPLPPPLRGSAHPISALLGFGSTLPHAYADVRLHILMTHRMDRYQSFPARAGADRRRLEWLV